jgi:hypothetical protein
MQHRIGIALQLVVVLVTGVLAQSFAAPQGNAPPSLQEQLEAQYQLTKMNGTTFVPGTVLVLLKEGMVGGPSSKPKSPVVKYSNGALQIPSAAVLAQFGKDSRPIPKGEKVYVTKISVNLLQDSVGLQIVQCGTCNGAIPEGSYSSTIGFQFARGSLKKASVPDIEDTIAQVFDIYTPPATPPPPKPPAPVVVTTVSEPLAKSLQNKLSSIGRVSWSETITTTVRAKRNKYTQVPSTSENWEELSQVTIDPHSCNMRMVVNAQFGKSSLPGLNRGHFVEEMGSVEVIPYQEWRSRLSPPSFPSVAVSPVVYSVLTNGWELLKVRDVQTGNEIAGELQQLARQCQAIPILPPTPNSGPSLAETMHFIEEKLNGNGSVNYSSTAIQTSDGSTGMTTSHSVMITQATADSSTCLLSYHEQSSSILPLPVVMSLRRVQKLEVGAHKDLGDSAQFTHNIEPIVFGLYVTFVDEGSKEILFREETMANRVAKAMNHAVELCGTIGIGNANASPEPF